MARLNGVLVLAARTARSRAYLQALSVAGFGADVLIYGPAEMEQVIASTPRAASRYLGDLYLPDFDRTLADSAFGEDWSVSESQEFDLREPALLTTIAGRSPRLLVFSGYPSQRVPRELIRHWPVLHIHGGSLPDYRGSTTIYYSMIHDRRPEVTAILVDGEIDTGNVVSRKAFPMPPAGMDIDYMFDSAIRADMLRQCMQHWYDYDCLPRTTAQIGDGHTYFIIHPLLKRLALLGSHMQSGEMV